MCFPDFNSSKSQILSSDMSDLTFINQPTCDDINVGFYCPISFAAHTVCGLFLPSFLLHHHNSQRRWDWALSIPTLPLLLLLWSSLRSLTDRDLSQLTRLLMKLLLQMTSSALLPHSIASMHALILRGTPLHCPPLLSSPGVLKQAINDRYTITD